MAKEPWKVTYDILKVNKQPYTKLPDLISQHRENIPGELKRIAETLADRYDFYRVKATARSMNTGEEFRFIFESDDGTRDTWVTGRQ